MKWEVQVSGDVFDLCELVKSINNDEMRITKRDEYFFVESILFNNLATDKEVFTVASDILAVLTGATRLSLGGRIPLQIVNVVKVREDGNRSIFLSVTDTFSDMRDSVGLEIQRSDGSIEIVNAADNVPDWIYTARMNPNVAKALRLRGTSKRKWVDLYRLFEVIEGDVGGIDTIAREGWATKNSIKRFKHTANSPGAIGDSARHGKESTNPPSDPMSIGEAVSFVDSILHNWLRSK